MATLSALKEVKEALDAGLVSQAEFDDIKLEYLTAKKEAYEFQRKALRAKDEAQKKELRAKEEFQKKELCAKAEALEFQKRELIAKEAFQQRKSEAELRSLALNSFVKHGSSTMSEEQKVGLARDYVKMSGFDRSAENVEPDSKRQRASSEERSAAAPQTAAPPAHAPTLFFSRSALVERDAWNGAERAPAPVAGAEAGKGLNESSIPNMRKITALLNNCCDEPGKSCTESEDAPPASASAPETATAGKSKKKPKKALSAYILFVAQKRGEVKEKYPELDNTAAMKQVGIMWKEASDAEKAPFEAMAAKDKIRYEEEKEAAAAAASKDAPPASAPETETIESSKKKRKKKDKDENKPKRGKSAYMFFVAQKRGEVKEKNPELSSRETMKKMGIMWKEASDAEKAPFEAMAKEEKIRYDNEKEAAAAAASKDAPPKRNKSAYIFFVVQKRGEVKEKNPELDNTAAMKQLGIMWKEASDAEKAPFEAMAAKDKIRFEEEINQYAKEAAAAATSGQDDSEDRQWQHWSVEEDQIFIGAHKEGKSHRVIAAMLPGRTEGAVRKRWKLAKKGTHGSAALRAYVAECLQR